MMPHEPPPDRQSFVHNIIQAYLRLPHTPRRAQNRDLQLAANLHQRGIPESIIQAAFLLGTFRRLNRQPTAPPLNPIRSLHYFLPVIEELLAHKPSPAYLRHLRRTVVPMIEIQPVESGSKKDVFT